MIKKYATTGNLDFVDVNALFIPMAIYFNCY